MLLGKPSVICLTCSSIQQPDFYPDSLDWAQISRMLYLWVPFAVYPSQASRIKPYRFTASCLWTILLIASTIPSIPSAEIRAKEGSLHAAVWLCIRWDIRCNRFLHSHRASCIQAFAKTLSSGAMVLLTVIQAVCVLNVSVMWSTAFFSLVHQRREEAVGWQLS